MRWRTVYTDTEGPTGVAPVCEDENHVAKLDPELVFDCCPHPHIQTWSEYNAAEIAGMLTDTGAELCS